MGSVPLLYASFVPLDADLMVQAPPHNWSDGCCLSSSWDFDFFHLGRFCQCSKALAFDLYPVRPPLGSCLRSCKRYLFWALGLRMSPSPTHSLHYLLWYFRLTQSLEGLDPSVSFQSKNSFPLGNLLLKAHLVEHFRVFNSSVSTFLWYSSPWTR